MGASLRCAGCQSVASIQPAHGPQDGPYQWERPAPADPALGYEHLRRHDLRHTDLTWMADAGVSCARSAEDRRTRFPHHNTTLPKGSGIARGGKETAGPQVNVVPEWHLRSARDSCLSRENHQALPTDAGYAAQAGMAEMACRAAACCRAASAPRRAERACGAGRLAYEPCGRQKAMQAAPRAGPAFGQFQYPTPPLHPDATAIAAAGDSLTAFLSVHRSPNGPQLRAVPNPARSTINMKKTR